MSLADKSSEAKALKEDCFHTRDVIAELSRLPAFLVASEHWLAEATAKLALKGCGREEIAYLMGIHAEALHEDLPSSFPEVGTPILDVAFLPSSAVCRIQGSVSSAHLNGKQCTLGRQLLADDTHALVHVEGEEAAGAMLLARKNLIFEAIGQLNESNAPPMPSEELPSPSQILGSSLPVKGEEAAQWLCAVVMRLLVKGCGKEEIGFILSLPAKGQEASFGNSNMPSSITADQLGQLLQDLSFCPPGAECRVEGAKSSGKLNGLQGVLTEACPGHASHAKLQLPGEGEVLIHRKNLRLISYAGLCTDGKKEVNVHTAGTAGLCSWCCSLSVAPKTSKIDASEKLTGELHRLADLKAGGLLSEDEFQAAKAKLLA